MIHVHGEDRPEGAVVVIHVRREAESGRPGFGLLLTLEEAKDLRRELGRKIEAEESEAEQRRKDGVRAYLGDFEGKP